MGNSKRRKENRKHMSRRPLMLPIKSQDFKILSAGGRAEAVTVRDCVDSGQKTTVGGKSAEARAKGTLKNLLVRGRHAEEDATRAGWCPPDGLQQNELVDLATEYILKEVERRTTAWLALPPGSRTAQDPTTLTGVEATLEPFWLYTNSENRVHALMRNPSFVTTVAAERERARLAGVALYHTWLDSPTVGTKWPFLIVGDSTWVTPTSADPVIYQKWPVLASSRCAGSCGFGTTHVQEVDWVPIADVPG